MTELISYACADHIAVIGLAREAKRNAINEALLEQLAENVSRAHKEAKVGIVMGHGSDFCAGLDLAEHIKRDTAASVASSRRWHEVFNMIARGQIPFVAALHGAVVGGGLELAASAHIRISDESAFFALPEGQRGIFVGGGGSVRIARLMSATRMADLMLTGRALSAVEAERLNLLHYVVEQGGALEKAKEIARRIASNAHLTNFSIVNALPRIQDMSYDDGLYVESLVAAYTQTSPEAEERLQAFIDKRAAQLQRPAKS